MVQMRGQVRSAPINDHSVEDQWYDPDPSNLPPVGQYSPRFRAISPDGNEVASSPRGDQATPPLEMRSVTIVPHDVPSTSTPHPPEVAKAIAQRLGKGLAIDDPVQPASRDSPPPYVPRQPVPQYSLYPQQPPQQYQSRTLPQSQVPRQYPLQTDETRPRGRRFHAVSRQK